MKIGFDNEKYLKTQYAHIGGRIEQFGRKLYLEFGGKLFDDYHASRVLPGFQPDSKLRMLKQLADQAEIIIAMLYCSVTCCCSSPRHCYLLRGRDYHSHQRRGYRKEQGQGRFGHHL